MTAPSKQPRERAAVTPPAQAKSTWRDVLPIHPAADGAVPAANAPPGLPALAEAQGASLAIYDAACRALAEAKSVYEAKEIRDQAIAMAVYARQAKNREMEADAVEIRLRATQRLAELIAAQKETVGLNRGTAGAGRPSLGGLAENPPNDMRPTLASQGIDKNLAHQARVLGAMSNEAFARKIQDARGSAGRVFRRAVREAEIEQQREERRAQTAQGGTVADLHALIASGYRAGVIAADPAWPFDYWSERAAGRITDHYDTMTVDAIKALPVGQLAAPDCALFLWVTWPNMPVWNEVIEAWGFEFSSLAFDWIKTNANGEGLHWGHGFATRQNPEPCVLARIGKPLRLDGGVHSVIMTPVGEHSEKPDEAYARMERLYGGPRLELFARKPRPNWTVWGNEIPRDAMTPPAEPAAAAPAQSASPRPRVLNVNNLAGEQPGTDRVYVGRNLVDGVRGKWGNPFRIGVDGTREEVVAKYRAWVTANPTLMASLPELAGKDLVCHCAPLACHGDVLLELANAPAAAAPPAPREAAPSTRARAASS